MSSNRPSTVLNTHVENPKADHVTVVIFNIDSQSMIKVLSFVEIIML